MTRTNTNYKTIDGAIDLQPADNGDYSRGQVEWITFFNKEGKAMISAPDVYRAGQKGSDELVKSLREDFHKGAMLVTSTRIIYNTNTLDARIVHNYGSNVVKQTKSNVVIPIYQDWYWTRLSKVLGTEEGKAYLRALFNTNDSADAIAKTLERLSGKNVDKLAILTPDQESRADRPKKAVGFFSYRGRLHVDGNGRIYGDEGRSHGVLVKPAKQAARKIAA